MDADANENTRMPYIYTFDSMFWAGLVAAFFGFLGLITRTIIKSNCNKVRCLGMECERTIDVVEEEQRATPNEFNLQL